MQKDIDYNGFKNLVRFYKSPDKIPSEDLKFILDNTFMKDFSDEERMAIVPTAEKYWRQEGFPYPEAGIEEITEEYDKLLDFDVDSLWVPEKKEMMQNNIGLNTVNSFHPHKYSVKCKQYRSPMTTFENTEFFRKVLFKTMKFSGNPFRRTGLRNMIGISSGTHAVSNFRPTVARYIYTKHCPVDGRVLDPSMGYSGRLFAALTSHISLYEGCDPCVDTFKGNQQLVKTIEKIDSKRNMLSCFMDDGERKGRVPNTTLHNIPFEEYNGESNFFDLVFTSPPYFDTERYSNEDTQSWKRYSKPEQWTQGFLVPLIKTSHRVLKKGGKLILNIYGNDTCRFLEEDTIQIAKEVFGHGVDDTIYLQMSKLMGIKNQGVIENRNDRFDHKIEPCFIWIK
jgi:hypothetical protein